MSELRDRNTVAMVAKYWGCSPRTVQRRIADGSLQCLRIGRIVRITREQVLEFEGKCGSGDTPRLAPAMDEVSMRRLLIAGIPLNKIRG